MSETPIRPPQGVVPTKDTKIVLAGQVKVPPMVWNWTPAAEKDAKEAFDVAHELGIPFYDTAEVYGNGESEREISRFRESYSEEEKKKQVIATKYLPENRTAFPDVLLSALRDSLARLGMQKADLYQIHAPIHPVAISVVGNALADAVQAGLVTTVGVSNYGLDEVREMHAELKKRGIQLASNQISYSLVRTIPEKSGLIDLCHELGKILNGDPIAIGMGLLTGKFGSTGPWPESRRRHFEKFDKAQLAHLLDTLKAMATKYDREQSAIALNWCIAKGTIPLAGARTAQHVRQNEKALNFLLTPEDIAELDKFAFLGENNKEWQHG
ncbi:NADP-dependent oxidoreductase domain-containing protein [Dichotomocladium elegans]|nr:NADP-dependent oxidoreductase domain-containing protein [Dichotomocladium elegans]